MADQDNSPPAQNPNDAQAAELRMRRHLGLSPKGAPAQQRPDQARQRHRFVQDGGVPVVMLNQRTDESAALRERIGTLEASLDAERNAHWASKKTIGELQVQITSLETRIVHAELAHREAAAQEQRARATLQEQIALLNAAPASRQAPTAAPAQVATAPSDLVEPTKKRGRPRIHPAREPKPVRWWTPSFKTKTKA